MATIIKTVLTGYNFVFNELADARTKDWFLCAKPYQGLTVLGIYFLFILKWGPNFMKNRQPYNLDRILIVYNTLQVIGCGWIFYYAVKTWLDCEYKLFCEPVDFSHSENAIFTAKLVYYFYITKFIDLIDTVFFVLRKKFHQVTFLHIYHHVGLVMLIWSACTYYPGGHNGMIGIINSFVHVVMYSYYLLSVAVPKLKGLFWFKKLVTQVQILQFLLCMIHVGSVIFIPDCGYPRWSVFIILPQNIFLLALFVDYYKKTYIRTPNKSKIIVPLDEKLHENKTKES